MSRNDDAAARILFGLPLDSQVVIAVALLADPVINKRMEKTEWFKRWMRQHPAVLEVALAAIERMPFVDTSNRITPEQLGAFLAEINEIMGEPTATVVLTSRELTLIRVACLQRLGRLAKAALPSMAKSYEETKALLNGKLWSARAQLPSNTNGETT